MALPFDMGFALDMRCGARGICIISSLRSKHIEFTPGKYIALRSNISTIPWNTRSRGFFCAHIQQTDKLEFEICKHFPVHCINIINKLLNSFLRGTISQISNSKEQIL